MQYLMLIYGNEKEWEKLPEAEMGKLMGEFGAFSEMLNKVSPGWVGFELQPTATATSLRSQRGKLETMDGPFAETKEQLGGFYLFEAKDLDAALAIAAKNPGVLFGTVEVRPVVPNQ
jgi:hypothetical protein